MSRSRDRIDQYSSGRVKKSRGDYLLGEVIDDQGWPTGQLYYLPQQAREMHLQVLGSTRRGKTKAVEAIVKEDIEKAKGGLLLIDPNGDFYHEILRFCARKKLEERVLLLDPSEDYIMGFNPLVPYTEKYDPINSVLNAFNKVYGVKDFHETRRLGRWSRNTFYALIDNGLNLTEGTLLLDPYNDYYRRAVLKDIKSEDQKKDFEFLIQLGKRRPEKVIDLIESTYNWFSPFIHSNKLKWIFGQRKTVIDIEKAYQEKKIILVNLGRESVNEEERRIIGTLILNAFASCAFYKTEEERILFYPVIDECQEFLNPDILDILRMAGKFKFLITLIHLDISDLEEEHNLRESTITNAQSKIIFGGLNSTSLEMLLKNVMSGSLNPAKIIAELEEGNSFQAPNWRLYQIIDEVLNQDRQNCLVCPFLGEPVKIKVRDLPPTQVSGKRVQDFKEYIFSHSGYYSHFKEVEKEIQERRAKAEESSQNLKGPTTFRYKRDPSLKNDQ